MTEIAITADPKKWILYYSFDRKKHDKIGFELDDDSIVNVLQHYRQHVDPNARIIKW